MGPLPDAKTAAADKNAIVIRNWAVSTTETWAKEVKIELRKQQRRENMVQLRALKKQQLVQLRRERDNLELEVKHRTTSLVSTGRKTCGCETEISTAMCQLAVESGTLRDANLQLHKQLQLHRSFQSLVHDASLNDDIYPSGHQDIYKATKSSPWVLQSRQNVPGWWVHFPGGEPSFYFTPLTKAESDMLIRSSIETIATSSLLKEVGAIFGWTIHRSLTRSREDKTLATHVRLTMRAKCSFDVIGPNVDRSPMNSWPLLVTPSNWSHDRRGSVCSQVLQEVDDDTRVMVTNVPGRVHTRYIQANQRQFQVSDNKRSSVFISVIADSKKNQQSRKAEQPHSNVQWVEEGGFYVKFTEIDDSTVGISYDHWAACESELHAQQLFVQWAQFVSVASQQLTQTQLLE